MKIQISSDIHNYDLSYNPKLTDSDVIVIAGDFDVGNNITKIRNNIENTHQKPVLYGLGNHDYWNQKTMNEWIETYHSYNTELSSFLENEVKIIDDVVFIFSTLWTDFDKNNFFTINEARASKDYSKISIDGNNNIVPDDVYNLYLKSRQFIIESLEKYKDFKCVVVTHFPPSIKCEKVFRITARSYSYIGYMEDIIYQYQPALWISGHIHNFFDEYFGDTRVILNPADKIVNNKSNLSSFDSGFCVEI